MLHDFLSENRTILIDRSRRLSASHARSGARQAEPRHGVVVFLDQLISVLSIAAPSAHESGQFSLHEQALARDHQIAEIAARCVRELLKQDFTLDDVLRDYRDVCQSITSLALDTGVTIVIDELQQFSRSLDEAIATAVA